METATENAPTPLSFRQIILLLCACISVHIGIYTNTALMAAIPTLVKTMSLTPTLSQWTIDSFFMTSVALIIPAGVLADFFGLKKFFFVGLALFFAGSVGMALAPNIPMIIGSRILEGAGFGFLMPLSLMVLEQALPDSFQLKATAAWAGAISLANGLGPTSGGFFVSLGDWRGIFWLSAGVMLLLMLAFLLSAPNAKFTRALFHPRKFHMRGFITFTITTIGFVYFLIEIQKAGLFSWMTIASACITVLFAILFWLSSRSATNAYVDLSFFTQRETCLSLTGVFFTLFALFQTLYFYTSYLQNYYTMNLPAVIAGTSLLLACFIIFFLSLFISRLTKHHNQAHMQTAGMILTAIGYMGLFLFAEVHPLFWMQLASLVVIGIGMGISYPLFPRYGLKAIPSEKASEFSRLIAIASGFGCAVGVASGGLVYKLYYHYSLGIGQKLTGLSTPTQINAYYHAAKAVTKSHAKPLIAHLPHSVKLAISYAVGSGFSHTMLLCAFIILLRAFIGLMWARSWAE